ncbi:MAG: DUF2029 domain-containing protein [Chloroflexi bacterium]|nr:DUF2029 domain-containing protein [Chloroflexota bacterium]
MVRRYILENKGKSLLVAGILLMWMLLGVLFRQYGYFETWELWRVPVHPPVFRDFLLIPGSAASFRNGFEPTVENPYDVGGRIFNYPAFWRLFFYTNISADDAIWMVTLLLVLYFVSAALFPQKLTAAGAVLMLLVLFSPASMLLYERGNADLFVFFICALIVLASGHSANWTAGLIVFGAIVKMYPLFGISVLFKETKKRFWRLAAACVLFVAIYGLLTFRSQSAAWNATMRGDGASYGSFVLVTRLGGYLQELLPGLLSVRGWEIVFEGAALGLILGAGVLAVRDPNVLTALHERNLAAFRMGASIYAGTFLLGNNWDYRLAFLVFTIPQLAEWLCLKNRKQQAIVMVVIVASLLSSWHFMLKFDLPFIPLKNPVNRNFVIDESINWLLLPGFVYLLSASFPAWLRQDLQKLFGKVAGKGGREAHENAPTPAPNAIRYALRRSGMP